MRELRENCDDECTHRTENFRRERSFEGIFFVAAPDAAPSVAPIDTAPGARFAPEDFAGNRSRCESADAASSGAEK